MGNSGSKDSDRWDSDEEGGSDYEHVYHYHTAVLKRSPADGFESDYEDDNDDNYLPLRRSTRGKGADQTSKPVGVTSPASSLSAADVGCEGDVKEGDGTAACHSQSGLQGQSRSGTAAHWKGEDDCESVRSPESACSSRDPPDPFSTQLSASFSGQAAVVGAEGRDQGPEPASGGRVGAPGPGREGPGHHGNRDTTRGEVTKPGMSPHTQPTTDLEEDYHTAAEDGEGGKDAVVEVSDDDSFSTVTPPRTRPQSDSDYSQSVDSTTEEDDTEVDDSESEEESTSGSDTVTEATSSRQGKQPSHYLRSSPHSHRPTARRRDRSPPPPARSSPSTSLRVPRREDLSPTSYRHARKRKAPAHSQPAMSSKRSKPANEIPFSPNRTRFGILDTESESDATDSRTQRSGRTRATRSAASTPHQQSKGKRETKSLSARTLRQAAKKAATQFVETSRKILRDAKSAARILTEKTSPKHRLSDRRAQESQSSAAGRRETRSSSRKMAELRREERLGRSAAAATPEKRSPVSRTGRKRKAEEEEVHHHGNSRAEEANDLDMEELAATSQSKEWRQVRKDGGRRRKFTRGEPSNSAALTSNNSRPSNSNVPSTSQPSLSPLTSGAGAASRRRGNMEGGAVCDQSVSSNPFQNVTLVPSSAVNLNKSTGSTDSITTELATPASVPAQGRGQGQPSTISPFRSLMVNLQRAMTPAPLTFSAGSVWARINTRAGRSTSNAVPASEPVQCLDLLGRPSPQPQPSPSPSPSRRVTRSSPTSLLNGPASASYPAQSTPRAPSLTLSGQFAQGGRFAFLIGDTLQITVANSDITASTTAAIVISTDSQLRHHNAMAQSVAKAAGKDFTLACQSYLKGNGRGLQVCEVLDLPAGGQLSPLISHILQVAVPGSEGSRVGGQEKKLLLCAYLNCLKEASERLQLSAITVPLLGAGIHSADECVQVFFDSLLVYLTERTPSCPLYAVHLAVSSPAIGRFAAEVLESRLEDVKSNGVDAAMATVFNNYFNIPNFSRLPDLEPAVVNEGHRNPSGKPALKRRRL